MSKGSQFERDFCQYLSLWWTSGQRDDVFWRTAGSGGRARTRNKTGRQTHGQHGDLCATDPIGEPLTKILTIECKRGYSHTTIGDLIDRPVGLKQHLFEEWIQKTIAAHEASKSFSWMLIVRRDKRKGIVFVSSLFYTLLEQLGGFDLEPIAPLVKMKLLLQERHQNQPVYKERLITALRQEDFFGSVYPLYIQAIVRMIACPHPATPISRTCG